MPEQHFSQSVSYFVRCHFGLWIILLMICSLNSCLPEPKSFPPVIISVVTTGQEHGAGAHAVAGNSSYIEVTAEDDLQLREVRCNSANTGEFHLHALHGGGLIPAFRAPNIGEWTDVKVKDIDSTFNRSNLKFSIPNTLSGVWLLTTAVIDNEGYVDYDEQTVIIENDSIPAIIPVATTPTSNADGVIELVPGETFTVNGNILDENYLASIHILITNNGQIFWQETIFPENQWLFDMSQLTMPAFTMTGQFDFTLEVIDRRGWKNWVAATINVK